MSLELKTVDEMIAVLEGLRRGDCWCEMAVDNPMMTHGHSTACERAGKLLSYLKVLRRIDRQQARVARRVQRWLDEG